MINKGKDMGLLNLSIPTNSTQDFPIIHYVDDTLIIDEGDARQLFFVKTVLSNFSLSIDKFQQIHDVSYQCD